ncbi:MAG: hypothetical protein UY28_C0004G0046 [Candidatus Amesbacteria bacterium GW2011_GWB1_48_13]|uniref:DUF1565 domain-containing protein n=1 Tax=Candidatus Amesbacteria bacterium GW2011_GWB1_48_13 TaxID=1618362 RepID=A0A0G1X6R9_9BACT|nr:MAG: hypothetical protein UY28_C0004G0046 [Candidatus Amesbacteria bacterium GW2011_GWB1_48_13]
MTEVNGGFYAVDDVGLISNPRGDSVLGLQRYTQNGRVAGHLYTFKSGVWTDINAPKNSFFVDPTGSNSNPGTVEDLPVLTLTKAIALCTGGIGETIYMKPGDYTEQVVIPVAKSNITIVGLGNKGSIFIEGTGATTILTNNAEGTTLVNITLEGDETVGSLGLLNRGKRLRYRSGRILNVATCAKFTLGTPTEVDAGIYSDGSDTLCDDVEFSWATDGVDLVGVTDLVNPGDFGTTQNYFRRCQFHNLSNSSFKETPLGGATQSFRDLEILDCIFKALEAGTLPTAFVLLNGDNANSGIVSGCRFPTALLTAGGAGKSVVSTKLYWTGNYHTGGISNAQPT